MANLCSGNSTITSVFNKSVSALSNSNISMVFNKNLVAITTPVSLTTLIAVTYKDTTKTLPSIFSDTTSIITKSVYGPMDGSNTPNISSRPTTGQMWPRGAPNVTTRTVVTQTPNPTNTIYLYTIYGGF